MCATNLWAVNAAAFSTGFERFTAERVGVGPQRSGLRIASSRVRDSSVVFTLTRRGCDCDSLVGRRDGSPVLGETDAAAWLGWLRELPEHAPHLARLAVLRAWSPQGDAVVPARSRGVRIGEVTEDELRDDALLTIDYPRAR